MAGQKLTNTIKLLKDTGVSPAVYGSVGNIVDATGPTFTNERIEVTDGDSPANGKEYLAARQDPGALQTTLNFDFSNQRHEDLITGMQEDPPDVTLYRIQYTDTVGNYLGGPAFVSSFALSGNTRGAALQAAVSFQPTQVWTLS